MVANWTFLTNHARVLLCIAHDPGVRLRDFGDRRELTAAAGGLRAIRRAEPPPPAGPVLTANAGAMRELLARLDPG
jgi:hypothetical protein